MKIICIECTADDLKTNRGLADVITDAMRGILFNFYGTLNPSGDADDEEADDGEA